MKRFEPYARSILRMVAAFAFTLHGLQKAVGHPGSGKAMAIGSLLWVAGVIESIGGSLMFVGLCTRPLAFVLCGEMAVAYFRSHFPRGPWPNLNGGEPAVLYCFIWLYLFFAGPGPISLDRKGGSD